VRADIPLIAWVLASAALAAEPPADRIFVNGVVWTGEAARPRAEALAVRGGRLAAVGTNADVRALAGAQTEVVDLSGRFVCPCFDDAHLHFLVLETVDLAGAADVAEVQRRIADYARSHPEAAWVSGRGWAYGAFPGGLPKKEMLDAVVSDRPAFMLGYDGHTAWVNSPALAAAGITPETRDPDHGVIVRDDHGAPTGVLKEAAMGLVRRLVPPPTDEDRYQALKKRLAQAASYGLTSVQNASFPPGELPVYERVIAEGGLKVRFYWAVPFVKDPPAETLARYEGLRTKYRGPLFKFGAVKGFVDGVVESRTAAMFEPYALGGGTGLPNWSAFDLNRTAAFYDKLGFQIFLHAIGDRAIHMALDAFEHAARTNGTRGRRHRVEHIEVPRPEDIPRFRELGVIASTQALFANPDPNTLEVYVPTLGPERAARAMPFRWLDEAGAVQAFGSDWPVYSMETLKGIYCAVTRTTPEGTPPGGWNPAQRISAEAALRHFTRDAAYASFDEDVKGTLAAGKLADFVVLSDDILQPPPERILKTKVLLTVMGGRDTHRDPAFPGGR
jgi:predicted amidohydrolase YtcJ